MEMHTSKEVTLPCNMDEHYRLVAWDVDTTGRSTKDNIFHIAAYTPFSTFSQYIMPFRDLNQAARCKYNVCTVNIGRFRVLKDVATDTALKTKTERAVMREFVDWLETVREKDGVILVSHEGQKLASFLLLQCIHKYSLMDRFRAIVKGFANSYTIAQEKCSRSMKSVSVSSLAQAFLGKNDKLHDAASRAAVVYEVAHYLCKNRLVENEADVVKEILLFTQSITQEEDELAELNIIMKRQESLQPIFVPMIQEEKYRADHLQRLLAEAEIDYETLNNIHVQNGYGGILELIRSKFPCGKPKDLATFDKLFYRYFEGKRFKKSRNRDLATSYHKAQESLYFFYDDYPVDVSDYWTQDFEQPSDTSLVPDECVAEVQLPDKYNSESKFMYHWQNATAENISESSFSCNDPMVPLIGAQNVGYSLTNEVLKNNFTSVTHQLRKTILPESMGTLSCSSDGDMMRGNILSVEGIGEKVSPAKLLRDPKRIKQNVLSYNCIGDDNKEGFEELVFQKDPEINTANENCITEYSSVQNDPKKIRKMSLKSGMDKSTLSEDVSGLHKKLNREHLTNEITVDDIRVVSQHNDPCLTNSSVASAKTSHINNKPYQHHIELSSSSEKELSEQNEKCVDIISNSGRKVKSKESHDSTVLEERNSRKFPENHSLLKETKIVKETDTIAPNKGSVPSITNYDLMGKLPETMLTQECSYKINRESTEENSCTVSEENVPSSHNDKVSGSVPIYTSNMEFPATQGTSQEFILPNSLEIESCKPIKRLGNSEKVSEKLNYKTDKASVEVALLEEKKCKISMHSASVSDQFLSTNIASATNNCMKIPSNVKSINSTSVAWKVQDSFSKNSITEVLPQERSLVKQKKVATGWEVIDRPITASKMPDAGGRKVERKNSIVSSKVRPVGGSKDIKLYENGFDIPSIKLKCKMPEKKLENGTRQLTVSSRKSSSQSTEMRMYQERTDGEISVKQINTTSVKNSSSAIKLPASNVGLKTNIQKHNAKSVTKLSASQNAKSKAEDKMKPGSKRISDLTVSKEKNTEKKQQVPVAAIPSTLTHARKSTKPSQTKLANKVSDAASTNLNKTMQVPKSSANQLLLPINPKESALVDKTNAKTNGRSAAMTQKNTEKPQEQKRESTSNDPMKHSSAALPKETSIRTERKQNQSNKGSSSEGFSVTSEKKSIKPRNQNPKGDDGNNSSRKSVESRKRSLDIAQPVQLREEMNDGFGLNLLPQKKNKQSQPSEKNSSTAKKVPIESVKNSLLNENANDSATGLTIGPEKKTPLSSNGEKGNKVSKSLMNPSKNSGIKRNLKIVARNTYLRNDLPNPASIPNVKPNQKVPEKETKFGNKGAADKKHLVKLVENPSDKNFPTVVRSLELSEREDGAAFLEKSVMKIPVLQDTPVTSQDISEALDTRKESTQPPGSSSAEEGDTVSSQSANGEVELWTQARGRCVVVCEDNSFTIAHSRHCDIKHSSPQSEEFEVRNRSVSLHAVCKKLDSNYNSNACYPNTSTVLPETVFATPGNKLLSSNKISQDSMQFGNGSIKSTELQCNFSPDASPENQAKTSGSVITHPVRHEQVQKTCSS